MIPPKNVTHEFLCFFPKEYRYEPRGSNPHSMKFFTTEWNKYLTDLTVGFLERKPGSDPVPCP